MLLFALSKSTEFYITARSSPFSTAKELAISRDSKAVATAISDSAYSDKEYVPLLSFIEEPFLKDEKASSDWSENGHHRAEA